MINEQFCLGTKCVKESFCCIPACPKKAITVRPNPSFEVLGDRRWTADLLASTWHMAETGEVPHQDLNYKTGDTGGGFDKIRFVFPEGTDAKIADETHIDRYRAEPLGRRETEGTIPVPFYFGGMSFGSVSIVSMLSRVRAAIALGTFCCTGEGGFPDELKPYDDHIITQVATGLFGVREETIQRVRIVEFKYAQGAKPGLGGHLLGDKVTPRSRPCARPCREAPSFPPSPFIVSTRWKTTRSTWTGSRRSIPGRS